MSKPATTGSFSAWMEKQNEEPVAEEEAVPLMIQLKNFNDGLATQLMELSGSLPDAPLSAAFRQRVQYAIYCLLGSIFFAVMAIIVGLPTLILKPTKFVLCITLSTILAIASIVVLQKPLVFLQSIIESGPARALPIVSLFCSFIFTLYCAIFIHHYRYIMVIFSACIQLLCIMWYIASFIPGGTQGLQVLLKMSYVLVSTAMQPCIFVTKRAILSFWAQLNS